TERDHQADTRAFRSAVEIVDLSCVERRLVDDSAHGGVGRAIGEMNFDERDARLGGDHGAGRGMKGDDVAALERLRAAVKKTVGDIAAFRTGDGESAVDFDGTVEDDGSINGDGSCDARGALHVESGGGGYGVDADVRTGNSERVGGSGADHHAAGPALCADADVAGAGTAERDTHL